MLALALFIAVICAVMVGYPVAFTLAGVSLLFAFVGTLLGSFDTSLLHAIPSRMHSIVTNGTLLAVPLFIFMGVAMQKSRIADELLTTTAKLFRSVRGGLGISVILIGTLLAASTGIVGATVTAMGLLSLPAMLKNKYSPELSCGTICAAGTLGQIIPPSIVLVLLGEVISAAYQQVQLQQGNYAPDAISVSDLFAGAVIPGLLLVSLYILWLLVVSRIRPEGSGVGFDDSETIGFRQIARAILIPVGLIVSVLGSILTGIATTTEAASVGAMGTIVLMYLQRTLNLEILHDVCRTTIKATCMVFMILIGATFFSLAFRGFGGDDFVHGILSQLPGGLLGAMIIVMLLMFLLGFVLDFIEITFIIVPIVAPTLIAMGADPVWLAVMIAVNLQTSFLTPPFGFALFYLRGVAPPEVKTESIYRGVMPFVGLQVLALLILSLWPGLVTWLPGILLD